MLEKYSPQNVRHKKTFVFYTHVVYNVFRCIFLTLYQTEGIEKSMKKIVQVWTGISLVQRIVAGLVIGALLGMFVPSEGGIAILGDVFVGALKAIAPLLVFFLVISSFVLCRGKSRRCYPHSNYYVYVQYLPCSHCSSCCKQRISCNIDSVRGSC